LIRSRAVSRVQSHEPATWSVIVRILLTLALCACLSACAVKPPKSKYLGLSIDAAASMRHGAFDVQVGEAKSLRQITAGDQAAMTTGAMFGIIGSVGTFAVIDAKAKRHGAALVSKHGLVDPSTQIVERVTALLRERYDATVASGGVPVRIETMTWSLVKGQLFYAIKIEIGTGKGKRALARGTCHYHTPAPPKRDADAPKAGDADALLADDARLLKAEIAQAAAQCIAEIDEQLLTEPTAHAESDS
jgi:hypothetical protein